MNHDLVRRWDVFVYLTEYYNHRTEAQHDALKEALSRVPCAEPEIIRCKDCKWFDLTYPYGTAIPGAYHCKTNDRFYGETHFCAYGERREDE